jgi:hypothetical protein
MDKAASAFLHALTVGGSDAGALLGGAVSRELTLQ